MLFLLFWITTVFGACPHEGITAAASDRNTWPHALDIQANLTLDFPILLDVSTPRLAGIRIVAGGRLVFSPLVPEATLTTDFVQIEDGGSLEIGSEECPFSGSAEIVLTGREGSYTSDNGEKFIAVEKGGRLEIHGREKRSWTRLGATVVQGTESQTIQLQDDVTSWMRGDRLVIASSGGVDEADEVMVEDCSGTTCTISGTLKHNHFGEEEGGVPMQAEVGLLSRNIVIRGEMETSCFLPFSCDKDKYDTFGGHIIAREGFATFKVEHAELRQMGQLGILGRYPVHWHMAGQLVAGDSYASNNSIHHTFQRCVTCHGSFGCQIQDNVAYEHLGHCYFLEDGVERDTVLQGNLGLGTRRTDASTVPSDQDPATFWITHPTALVTGNVAAGSEGKGFWFLQANLPTGAAGRQQAAGTHFYFNEGQLFRTPLKGISGNTAHSSTFGMFFDRVLQPDQGAGGGGKFSPRRDPTDPRSPRVRSVVQNLTCYKSSRTCLWFRFKDGAFSGLKVADSGEGMFAHDDTTVTDSVFIGESENFRDDERKKFRRARRFGFRNYLNPCLLSEVSFQGFRGDLADGGSLHALGLRRVGSRSLYTGGTNLSFPDTFPMARISEDKKDGRQFLYRDWTGSITSSPGSYVVSNLAHLVDAGCSAVGRLAVCPHHFYTISSTKGAELTRLDIPDSPFTTLDNENFFAMNCEHPHLLSFPGGLPLRGRASARKLSFQVSGSDVGTR